MFVFENILFLLFIRNYISLGMKIFILNVFEQFD